MGGGGSGGGVERVGGIFFFFFESQIRLLFSDGKERSAKRGQVFAVRFTLQEEGAPARQTDGARVSDAFWVTVLSYAGGVSLRVVGWRGPSVRARERSVWLRRDMGGTGEWGGRGAPQVRGQVRVSWRLGRIWGPAHP